MNTFRRRLIDKFLLQNVNLMTGHVLDVGGKKIGKRGSFLPPEDQVESWKYVNLDKETNPDFVANAESLPVEDRSIDVVIMTELLEYLKRPEFALREARRVLKDGGVCVVTVPFMIPIHGDDHMDRWRFTELVLDELSRGAGFKDVKINKMGSVGSVLYDMFHVAFGYASSNSFFSRVGRRLLRLSSPFFRFLDVIFSGRDRHITGGYGLIMR